MAKPPELTTIASVPSGCSIRVWVYERLSGTTSGSDNQQSDIAIEDGLNTYELPALEGDSNGTYSIRQNHDTASHGTGDAPRLQSATIDTQPAGDQIGALGLETSSGTVSVPLYDPADVSSGVRVETGSGIGHARLVSASESPLRIETSDGIRGIERQS